MFWGHSLGTVSQEMARGISEPSFTGARVFSGMKLFLGGFIASWLFRRAHCRRQRVPKISRFLV